MSLFADKWTSPFNNNPFGLIDFHTTSFGEFGSGPNFSLFGKNLEDEECNSLKMRLRNGSVVTEGGFYDHFDSVFGDRSRPYNLRTAVADSTRRSSSGRGKEYIIPIKIETSPKGENPVSNKDNSGADSVSSTASNMLTSTSDSSVEIPTRGCSSENGQTRRSNFSKSRSPILPQHSKVSPSYKVLTPTTEEGRNSHFRDNSCDIELDGEIFFIKSETAPQRVGRQGEVQAGKPESDIEIVEIEDDDAFVRSLRRKPLRHFQNTQSVSSQETVFGNRSRQLMGNNPPNLTSDHVKSRSEQKETERSKRPRPVCSHPGPMDVTAPPSYPIYGYLKPKLTAQDRQIDYIRGDGNCFFRAISKAVYGSEDYHAECRQAVCDLIHSHPDLFRQYIDHSNIATHVNDMRVQATWATTCEIYAAATLLGREIYVLAPSPSNDAEYHWLLFSPRPLTGSTIGESLGLRREDGEPLPCYVTLCHTNANHYDHINPISARCNCQLAQPSLNGVSMMLDLTSADQEDVLRTEV